MRKPRQPHDYELRVRRRALLAATLPVFARLVWFTALALVAVFAVGRALQFGLRPEPLWAALLIPLAVLAALRASRRVPDALSIRAFADRRAAAAGLLLLGEERDLGPWSSDLAARVAQAEVPSVAWQRSTLHVGCAVLTVAMLGLVPPPEVPAGKTRQVAVHDALERLREEMKAATAADTLPPAQQDELQKRAEEIEKRLLDGDPVSWGDVDALHDALDKQEAVHRDRLAQMVAQAGDLLDAQREGRDLSTEDLAQLADLAQQLDLKEGLDPKLRDALARLQEAMAGQKARERGSSMDPQALAAAGLDAEQLRQLTEQLKQLGGNRLSHASLSGRVPEPELSDLRDLLEKQGMLGENGEGTGNRVADGGGAFDPTPRDQPSDGPPGRGGVSRGRADAQLEHSGSTEIDTTKLKAERLVPGEPFHDRWQTFGAVPAEPTPDNRSVDAGGGAAAAGSGAASFHRDLAPRHRAVVERFFTPDPVAPRRR